MLLYLLRHSLPQQSLKAPNKDQKEEIILEEKKTISVETLCDCLPQEFVALFNHIRPLGFDEKPKYSYWRKIFRDLFACEGFKDDNVVDWTILSYMQAT